MASSENSINPTDTKHYYLRAPDTPQDKIDRLENQAAMFRYVMDDKIIIAPIDWSKPNLKIIDTGTPNGASLSDMTKLIKSPTYELHGTYSTPDYFPTAPPPHTTFTLQDVQKPWPDSFKGAFDLVHERMELGSCVMLPPKEVVRNLCSLVAPGGYIQLGEMDVDKREGGPAFKNHVAICSAIFDAAGVGHTFSMSLAGWLKEFGFEDVEEKRMDMKMGKACEGDEEMGRLTARLAAWATGSVAEALRMMGPEKGGVGPEQVAPEWEERLEKELLEEGGVGGVIWAYGRKPVA